MTETRLRTRRLALTLTALLAAPLVAGCAHDAPPVASQPLPPLPDVAPPAPPPPPPPPPPPSTGRVKATEFKVEGNTLVLPGPVTFVPASDKLTPASDAVLQLVEDYLDAKPEVTLLRVEGHTSSEGNVAVNQALSEKRALAVVRWLVGVGIKCERLLPVGFGHTKPIVPNDTRENRATNERIVVVAAQIGGKAPSGLAVDGGGKGAGNPCK